MSAPDIPPPIPPSNPPTPPSNPLARSVRPPAVIRLDAVDNTPCAASNPPVTAPATPPRVPVKKEPIIEDAVENNEFTAPPTTLFKKFPTNPFAAPIILLKAQESASKAPLTRLLLVRLLKLPGIRLSTLSKVLFIKLRAAFLASAIISRT